MKVISDPGYRCHPELKEKGVILVMSMSKKAKILINSVPRGDPVPIIDHTSRLAM